MKCLTVCQPWAWTIMHGPKRVENRAWYTSYRGPLAIHAGKSREWLGAVDDIREAGVDVPDDLVFGAVLGLVDLVDVIRPEEVAPDQRIWACGPYCWLIDNPRPFPRPIPARGALSLWSW